MKQNLKIKDFTDKKPMPRKEKPGIVNTYEFLHSCWIFPDTGHSKNEKKHGA